MCDNRNKLYLQKSSITKIHTPRNQNKLLSRLEGILKNCTVSLRLSMTMRPWIFSNNHLCKHNRDSDLHARSSMRLSIARARIYILWSFDRQRTRLITAGWRYVFCLTHRVMRSDSRRFRHYNFFRSSEIEVEFFFINFHKFL